MRKLFINAIGCSMAALALLATACQPDQGEPLPTPNFPEQVTAEVVAGDIYTIAIEPNQDWTVSIPEDATYFTILDNENEVYSVSGEAGSYEIQIKVADIRDYNNDYSCDVTLAMGNKESVIASLTLGRIVRSIEIYDIKFEDNMDWMYGAETQFEYWDEPIGADGVTLNWGENGLDMFCHRVKIVSNFTWKIDGTPAWIQAIENNEKDVTELWIKGDASNYPMEASTATLSFLDANDNSVAAVATLKVSIDSAKSIFGFEDFDSEYKFNHEGKLYNIFSASYYEGNAEGSVISVNEELCAYTISFEEMGGGFIFPSFENEWINCTVSEWDATESSKIQYRDISISVAANEDADREALVVIIPKSIVDTFEDANEPYELLEMSSTGMGASGKLLAEFEKYHATTIKQLAPPGVISFTNEAELPTVMWKKVGNDSDISYDYPTVKDGYELLYTNKWDSEDASFSFNGTYTSVEYTYFDSNSGNLITMSESDSWVKVNPFGENGGFKLVMEPKSTTNKHWNTESYYNGAYWSYVAFKNGDNVVAVISCLYNLDYDLTGGGNGSNAGLSFAYPQYATDYDGSSLVQETSGEYYQMIVGNFGEMPVWHLTYTQTSATMSALSGINTEWSALYVDEADKSWLSFEMGEMSTVTMKESGNGKSGILIFKDSNNIMKLALICTLNIK